jgi:hypothetical protein
MPVIVRPPSERFWPKVEKTEGCWEWTAATNGATRPYGVFWDGRRQVLAHRFSFEMHRGPIPTGLVVDHLCRNTRCVRPDHLDAVPQAINLLRGDTVNARGAAKTHCPSGHAYDQSNTVVRRGKRECRACNSDRNRAYRRSRR